MLPWTPHQVLFFLFFFLNTLNMDFFEKKTPFFGCFLFQSSLFHKFLCGTQYTLYLLTMSYDALTTAGRHLLSAEAFSFADDGKDAIKDFEWSAFSFFFWCFASYSLLVYIFASFTKRRPAAEAPRRFSREQDNACIRAKSARARSLLPPRCLEKKMRTKERRRIVVVLSSIAPFFAAFLDPSIHSKAVARRIFLLCKGVLNLL